MITQEQYLELEAKIREDLPRLLEPTEGCWLHTKGYENIKFKIIHRRAKEFIVDDYRGHKPIDYRTSVLYDYFEIIGHDILLTDVLEWINEYSKTHIIALAKGDIKYVFSNIIYLWDLSNSCLKDQSDKLKEFLHNLIMNEKNKQCNIVQNINNEESKINSTINIGNINGNVIL